MGLIVAEALLLGVLGGASGHRRQPGDHVPADRTPRASSDMLAGHRPLRAARCEPMVGRHRVRVALVLGFAAGFVPALNAYRSRITDMLRTV